MNNEERWNDDWWSDEVARLRAIRAVVASQWVVGVRLLIHYSCITGFVSGDADVNKPSTWTCAIDLAHVDAVSEDGTYIGHHAADEIRKRARDPNRRLAPGEVRDDLDTLLVYLERSRERNSARKVMDVLLYDAPTAEQIVDGTWPSER